MIITRVPYRVSFLGGGTDFHSFYSKTGTTIVSCAIDKYCYVSVRRLLPYFGIKYRLCWSKIEEVANVSQIAHPSIRECIRHSGIKDGLEIQTMGDLPARTGIGSSSSFTAALLACLDYYDNKTVHKDSLTSKTISMEQDVLKEQVGIQDQIQVVNGGFNIVDINPDSTYNIRPIDRGNKLAFDLQDSIILVYSGIIRDSSKAHLVIEQSISPQQKYAYRRQIYDISTTFSKRFYNNTANLNTLCDAINESWQIKRSMLRTQESYGLIEKIYAKAMQSGAMAGKVLGAGMGGFLMFIVPSKNRHFFLTSMSDYVLVPVGLSFTGFTRIL